MAQEEYGWFIDPATGKEKRMKAALAARWSYQRARPENVTDLRPLMEPASVPIASPGTPGSVHPLHVSAEPELPPEEYRAVSEPLIKPLEGAVDVNDGGAYVVIAFEEGYKGIKGISGISGKETPITAHLMVSALVDALQEARKAENQSIEALYTYANERVEEVAALKERVKIHERVGTPKPKKGGKR